MVKIEKFIIKSNSTGRDALRKLDKLASAGGVLFIQDKGERVVGSLTDGDIRRGLLKSLQIDDTVDKFMNINYHYLNNMNNVKEQFRKFKNNQIRFIPLLNKSKKLAKIFDTQDIRTILPIDAVIIAGGKGERLMPLTKDLPKPLLKVGNKPIIEHNIDRLIKYGVSNITICVRHLGQKIKEYFGNGNAKGISINYVMENEPLGTIGSLSLVNDLMHEYTLVMNSDLLTNIDFEDFYETFIEQKADMQVAAIPYNVNVPYAVFELKDDMQIADLKEKPQYTYYSNAGIYLMKKELLRYIPLHKKFDATDLMNLLIVHKKKVTAEPILGYWLDIGKIEDYAKAQVDIKHLNL